MSEAALKKEIEDLKIQLHKRTIWLLGLHSVTYKKLGCVALPNDAIQKANQINNQIAREIMGQEWEI